MFLSEKGKKRNAKKQFQRVKIIDEHRCLFPTVFSAELFSTFIPNCVLALSGSMFKKSSNLVSLEMMGKMFSILFFSLMPTDRKSKYDTPIGK